MGYFLSHIIYVIIAAAFIGVLALVWAFGAQHNAGSRDPEMQEKQDHACESCSLASMCSRMGQKRDEGPCEDRKEEPAGLRLVK